MSKHRKRLYSLLAVFVLALAASTFFVATTPGAGMVLSIAERILLAQFPELDIETDSKTPLYKGIHFRKIAWTSPGFQLHSDDIGVVFALACKQRKTLCIESLAIDQLALQYAETATPTAKNPASLPQLRLPLGLAFKNITIKQTEIGAIDSKPWLTNSTWTAQSLSLRGDRIKLGKLRFQLADTVHTVSGDLRTSGHYPLTISHQFFIPGDHQRHSISGRSKLSGSVQKLRAEIAVLDPQAVHINAEIQPLNTGIPLVLHLRAPALELSRWASEQTPVQMKNASLSLQGELAAFKYDLDAKVFNADPWITGATRLTASGRMENKTLFFDKLRLATGDSYASASGVLAWNPPFKAVLDTHFNTFAVDQMPLFGKTTINGHSGLVFSQKPGNSGWLLELTANELGLQNSRTQLVTNGVLKTGDTKRLIAKNITVTDGENSLVLNGDTASIDMSHWRSEAFLRAWLASSTLKASVNAPALGKLHPDIAGALNAQVILDKRGDISLQATGEKLQHASQRIGQLSLQAHSSKRLLSANNNKLALSINAAHTESLPASDFNVRINGGYENFDFSFDGKNETMVIAAASNGRYNSSNDLLRVTVSQFDVTPDRTSGQVQLYLADLATFSWQGKSRALSFKPFCIAQRDHAARICASQSDAGQEGLAVAIALKDISATAFSMFLPRGLRWQGTIEGDASVKKIAGAAPWLSLGLRGNPGFIEVNGSSSPVQLPYQTFSIDLLSKPGEFNVTAALDGEHGASLSGQLALSGGAFNSIDSSLVVKQLPLSIIAPMVSGVEDFGGTLEGSIKVSHTIQQPQLQGHFSLQQGWLQVLPNTSRLEDIRLSGDFADDTMRLAGSFIAGDGSGDIKGKIQFSDIATGQLSLTGENLSVEIHPQLDIAANLDLNAALSGNAMHLTGLVDVPYGKINVPRLPKTAQRLSKDVVLPARENAALSQRELLRITTGLNLKLGPDLFFSGYDLSGQLQGALNYKHRPESNNRYGEASGELRITDGKFRGYGQRLDILDGRLLFSGSIEQPDIYVNAIRTVQDLVVGVRVSGRPDALQLTPYSEPALPDNDVIFSLVTGRKPGQAASSNETQMVSRALLSQGIKWSDTTLGERAGKLGIDNFSIGTGDNTDLLVSGNLNRNVYVEYGTDITGDGRALKIRWDIARRLSVEMVGGLQQALDFLYTREF